MEVRFFVRYFLDGGKDLMYFLNEKMHITSSQEAPPFDAPTSSQISWVTNLGRWHTWHGRLPIYSLLLHGIFCGFFYVLNYFDQTKFTIPNLTLQNPDGVSIKDRERSQQHGCHGAAWRRVYGIADHGLNPWAHVIVQRETGDWIVDTTDWLAISIRISDTLFPPLIL